jgi:phosphatidylserine/phosphatidylglycerophosphate/cardiolipin synthase-like enzyme
VQAYGFTHNAIAQALVRAHQRGVKVYVLLDKKSEKTNRYVIDMLTQAQVDLRYDGKHAIAHNKVMVIDESVVITGSFNFTNSAETRNAENLLLLKSGELARRYKSEWQIHWAHGTD